MKVIVTNQQIFYHLIFLYFFFLIRPTLVRLSSHFSTPPPLLHSLSLFFCLPVSEWTFYTGLRHISPLPSRMMEANIGSASRIIHQVGKSRLHDGMMVKVYEPPPFNPLISPGDGEIRRDIGG